MHAPPLIKRFAICNAVLLIVLTFGSARGHAQDTAPLQAPATRPTPTEIDFSVINLPTTLPMARHRSYFRLTHRFARDLGRGDFGSLLEDLFSLDNGAIIGLEYRFGVTTRLHVGAHRSMLSKTIQLLARYDAWRQSDGAPVSVSFTGSLEGLNNLQQNRQPGIGATISRMYGSRLAVYLSPTFVKNTLAADFLAGHDEHGLPGEPGASPTADHYNGTLFLGIATRLRAYRAMYVAGEFSPRLAGHDPERGAWGVAIERRTRGHTFQMNFTNSFGTTFGQIARGGPRDQVYLGFNITRQF